MLTDRLKTLREQKGLTRKEVSEAVGLESSTYGKYEKGQRQPSYQILLALAEFYNVSVDYLTGYSPSSKAVSQEHLTNVNNRIKEELGENVKVMFHDINSFDDDEMEQLKFAIEMIKNSKRKKTP